MYEKISKISLKNSFGIKEVNIYPGTLNEISGKTGSGKTSVLDSLKLLLTNKGARTRYINDDAKEAILYIETESGTEITRTKKREGTDKINITQNKALIDETPQAFLNKLFSEEQFNPLKFVGLSANEQKKILLSLIEIETNEQNFVEWFGEIPQEYNSQKHILEILEKLGSDKSKWYLDREEIGRQKRAKEAVRNDHYKEIPAEYNPADWRELSLADKYSEIEKKSAVNNQIEKCQTFLNNYDEKIQNLNNKYDLKVKDQEELKEFKIEKVKKNILESKEKIENEISEKEKEILRLEKMISDLKNEIKNSKDKIETLTKDKLKDEIEALTKETNAVLNGIEESKKIEHEKYEEQKQQAEKYVSENKLEDIEKIKQEAEYTEKMKGFIVSWDKAAEKEVEINELKSKIEELTNKIEIARSLPGELIQKSNLKIDGLRLENGDIEILNEHGKYMLIDGLSDGEKMKLAIKIAALKSKELGVVFCDGTEKLDDITYKNFVKECAKTGLQFFFTRTTTDEFTVKTYNFEKEDLEND